MIERRNNHIYAYGTIGESYGGEWFASSLREAAQYGDPVIHLSTYGGSTMDGAVMISAIRDAGRPTTVRVEGMAASMGAIVMLSASRVEIAQNALVMVHAPSIWGGGTQQELAQQSELLGKVTEALKSELRSRGIADDRIDEWFDGTDHWFTAEEAVAAGLADEVIKPVVKAKLTKPQGGSSAVEMAVAVTCQLNGMKPTNQNINMLKSIAKKLGLAEDATEQQVIDEIEGLQVLAQERDAVVQARIDAMLDDAVQSGQITAQTRKTYASIGKTMGAAILKETLDALPKRTSAMSFIRRINTTSVADPNKKFDDYTAAELSDMRANNRELYDQLLEEKYK